MVSEWRMTDEQAKTVRKESGWLIGANNHDTVARVAVEAAVRLGIVVPVSEQMQADFDCRRAIEAGEFVPAQDGEERLRAAVQTFLDGYWPKEVVTDWRYKKLFAALEARPREE